ncbi:MAG: hypothetical protein UU74_C0017G0005 [Candidatus Woesebacteria bacterium GW2011_GWA1_41_7]|uniref:Uncharacterized protein n=1 Tax=Candidatus Woesebacteria bacterium GW2011_GWA1_41_7 TaxID=1618556 RepID=A0A0G0X075_9BACT|nr:MAG: hypothetical protein UU74_C0017G0005 [Candidatus Woesebacteria bacterium GW2011_GWA1_41_7]
MSSEAYIENIISNAIATATNSTEQAQDAADSLINESIGFYIAPPSTTTGFQVTATEPDIPDAADSTLTYEAQLEKLIALLSNQLANFFTTYYPLSNDAFDEATTWLVNTITNGGTGINANIEDQAWQRDRDRRTAEGRKLKAGVAVGYAAKGHFIVAGSMLKKMEEIDFVNAANNGIGSTNKAVEQLKIEIETVRFAVGKAIDSRNMAMNAAADYVRAIASAPDAAARVASLNTDVKAKMMSAAADFYRVRLERDNLVLKSSLANMDSTVDVYKHRRTIAVQADNVKIQALASAADVFARTASAALSSLNSIVSSAVNSFA